MEEVRETMRCVKGKSRRERLGARRDGVESGAWVGVDEKDTRKKYPKVGEWNVEILEEQEEIKRERGHKEWDWAESGNQKEKKKKKKKITQSQLGPHRIKGYRKRDEMRMKVEMEDEES